MARAGEIVAAFEQAMVVPTINTESRTPGGPRALFRCRTCEALVAGSWRAAHRLWHIEQGHAVITPTGET
jgi:hypothetical protein